MDSDESTIIMGAEELHGSAEHLGSEAGDGDSGSEGGPRPSRSPVPPTPAERLQALAEKAKFYTSLCLGTSAILAVFAFLFLIPFVVEPAIATILADFESDPVTCVVSEHLYVEGLRNCSWASCREGCTTAHTRCYQILVNYSRMPFSEFTTLGAPPAAMEWDITDTHYLVNTEGCGYPPRVNCTVFAAELKKRFQAEAAFPCYYSKVHPLRVVDRYSWPATIRHLAMALAAPPIVFAVAVGTLAYWHCACCSRPKGGAPKEDKLLCDELDLDEPEDALYCRTRSGSRDTDALWKG